MLLRKDGWRYVTTDPSGLDVSIVPIPWVWPSSAHYGCVDQHNLERIAIDLLSAVHPTQHDRVSRWIAELRDAGEEISWKSAARLWNAQVLPEASGAGF